MSQLPTNDPRRSLPALDRLLADPRLASLERVYGREPLVVQARRALAARRQALSTAALPEGDGALVAELAAEIAQRLAGELPPPLRRTLNATGIFLHTNLGRAPLPRDVAVALPDLLTAACDLEIDLPSGRRGDRLARIAALLERITGAPAALAVNNNAAALLLVLGTLARGREVVVSRGELVEIGDSFRVPDLVAAAGAALVEVGTTNRTHAADYERALSPRTALLLKVHPSNYRVEGFVAAVDTAGLAAIARGAGVPLVVDEGAGLLRRRREPELAGHPSFEELLAAGADLVCGSGDKLLGGPQAGLLVGRAELVERCHRHPLYRALRLGRSAAAALDHLLRRHLAGRALPLDALWPEPAAHRARLERAAALLGAACDLQVEIVAAEAFVGGGAAPAAPIAGEALALPGDEALARRLRAGEPAVVGYLRAGRLLLDLRTVASEDDDALIAAALAAVAGADVAEPALDVANSTGDTAAGGGAGVARGITG